MIYVVPFHRLLEKIGTKSANGQLQVTLTFDEFKGVIKMFLRGIEVDEEWYRREYADIAEAIDAKKIRSAKEHFVEEGYFEGRLPRPHEIDEAWYTGHYEDVAEGLRNGSFTSALRHFKEHGYAEGRFPAEY